MANWFLKVSNLLAPIKQGTFISSQKLVSRNFWQVADCILNKSKSTIPPLFI